MAQLAQLQQLFLSYHEISLWTSLGPFQQVEQQVPDDYTITKNDVIIEVKTQLYQTYSKLHIVKYQVKHL